MKELRPTVIVGEPKNKYENHLRVRQRQVSSIFLSSFILT